MPDSRQKQIDNAYFRLVELQADIGTPCEQDPKWFFPEDLPGNYLKMQGRKIAIDLCNQCPLIVQCREYAIMSGQHYGVYGGIDFHERNL